MVSEIYLKKIDLELNKRKSLNPRYSLRAFARDLEISVSILSRIRTRSLPISNNLKQKLKEKLFKSDEEFNSFSANCLCNPDFGGVKNKFDSCDFYYFRYWYFWTIWELSKVNATALDSLKLSQEFSIPESDIKAILQWITTINQSINAADSGATGFDSIFKNLNQNIFEERYIQLIHQMPTSPLNEVKPFVSQKAYPLAVNKELANIIQEKILKLTEEITILTAQDKSPKDHICELVISLLPTPLSNQTAPKAVDMIAM